MSESYKTTSDGLYFVSFSVVGWMDVFVRREYQDILVESITFCQKNKNLKIYCYCIMPSHVHFISYSENGELSNILRDKNCNVYLTGEFGVGSMKFGSDTLVGTHAGSAFLVKYDSNGNQLWGKGTNEGPTGYGEGYGVAVAP